MKQVDIGKPECKKVVALLDCYLDDELTVESIIEVLRHLEACPQCLEIYEIRRRLKFRLRQVIRKEDVPSDLQAKISKTLRRTGRFWFFGQELV